MTHTASVNANSSAHSGLCFSNTSRITSPISCGRFRVVLLESVMGLLLFFRFLSLHQGPESLRLGLHLVNGTGLLIGIMGDEALGDESFVVKQGRSEEHTSELQSLMRISYAVFCLKNKTQPHYEVNNLLIASPRGQTTPRN